MYFWKTHLLVGELAKGPLEERVQKNYYLATSVLSLLCYYIVLLEPRENLSALILETLGVLIATIVGLNAAFVANGGCAGTRFLEKVIAISFPLLIKVLVAGFAQGFFLAALKADEWSKIQIEWVSAIASIAIQSIFLLCLVAHVRKTNA